MLFIPAQMGLSVEMEERLAFSTPWRDLLQQRSFCSRVPHEVNI